MTTEDEREQARLARKKRRRSKRRQEILDAALELLREVGAANLTMAEMARRADLTKPALYYYFKTKEALLAELTLALIEEDVDAILTRLDGVEGGVASLAVMIRERVRLYERAPHRFDIVWTLMQSLGPTQADTLQVLYESSWRLQGELERRVLIDQEAGRLHPELHPRRLTNIAFMGVQGILATAHGMAAVGGALRFSLDALAEELVRTLELAARMP